MDCQMTDMGGGRAWRRESRASWIEDGGSEFLFLVGWMAGRDGYDEI